MRPAFIIPLLVGLFFLAAVAKHYLAGFPRRFADAMTGALS